MEPSAAGAATGAALTWPTALAGMAKAADSWKAQAAPAFEVDAGWAARIDEAIGRALAARGRVP